MYEFVLAFDITVKVDVLEKVSEYYLDIHIHYAIALQFFLPLKHFPVTVNCFVFKLKPYKIMFNQTK